MQKSNAEPTFKSVFGESWDNLPPVMHKHYANRPFSDDVVVVEGKMDIEFNWLAKLLSPLLRMFGTLVPYHGNDIPVTVSFLSEPDSHAYCLSRVFNFPGKKPFHFNSKMVQIEGDDIVEFMKFGIGWRHRLYYNGEKVVLEHRGYVWKLFGKIIPTPVGLFLGKGYAEEIPLTDNSFRMKMNITHPWWGKVYEYRGEFEVTKELQ